jgi:hypothetical protein
MLDDHANFVDNNHVADIVRVLDEDEDAGAKEFLHGCGDSERDGSKLRTNCEYILREALRKERR